MTIPAFLTFFRQVRGHSFVAVTPAVVAVITAAFPPGAARRAQAENSVLEAVPAVLHWRGCRHQQASSEITGRSPAPTRCRADAGAGLLGCDRLGVSSSASGG